MRTIAVIGAGPIGLEATLAALESGLEVALYERGAVAESVQQWGHVRMFSPFEMNSTELGRAKLNKVGLELPAADELLTGHNLRDRYLLPLANILPTGVLHEHCDVVGISRSHGLKGDHIGATARGIEPPGREWPLNASSTVFPPRPLPSLIKQFSSWDRDTPPRLRSPDLATGMLERFIG